MRLLNAQIPDDPLMENYRRRLAVQHFCQLLPGYPTIIDSFLLLQANAGFITINHRQETSVQPFCIRILIQRLHMIAANTRFLRQLPSGSLLRRFAGMNASAGACFIKIRMGMFVGMTLHNQNRSIPMHAKDSCDQAITSGRHVGTTDNAFAGQTSTGIIQITPFHVQTSIYGRERTLSSRARSMPF